MSLGKFNCSCRRSSTAKRKMCGRLFGEAFTAELCKQVVMALVGSGFNAVVRVDVPPRFCTQTPENAVLAGGQIGLQSQSSLGLRTEPRLGRFPSDMEVRLLPALNS
jgi:hypothetical protein